MPENREIFIPKKEEYESRKKEKRTQSRRRQFLKSLKSVAVWITVVLTIAFTGAGIFLSVRQSGRQSGRVAIENYILRYPIQGREHLAVDASHPDYNSNPPTSGWHYAEEALWRIYERELPDEQLVHNLEHCGIWISYQPNIPGATKEELLAFSREFPTKVIVTPREKNDSPIVLATWGILMKLPSVDRTLMSAFIASFLNKNGPECQAQ